MQGLPAVSPPKHDPRPAGFVLLASIFVAILVAGMAWVLVTLIHSEMEQRYRRFQLARAASTVRSVGTKVLEDLNAGRRIVPGLPAGKWRLTLDSNVPLPAPAGVVQETTLNEISCSDWIDYWGTNGRDDDGNGQTDEAIEAEYLAVCCKAEVGGLTARRRLVARRSGQ